MTKKLDKLRALAENAIICRLEKGVCAGRDLEKVVLLAIKPEKSNPEAIHALAYILAYKELEAAGKIRISRSSGLPFPMTDFETKFEVLRF